MTNWGESKRKLINANKVKRLRCLERNWALTVGCSMIFSRSKFPIPLKIIKCICGCAKHFTMLNLALYSLPSVWFMPVLGKPYMRLFRLYSLERLHTPPLKLKRKLLSFHPYVFLHVPITNKQCLPQSQSCCPSICGVCFLQCSLFFLMKEVFILPVPINFIWKICFGWFHISTALQRHPSGLLGVLQHYSISF